MKLQDRVAIVTGGGRGIGRAIALAYASEGASVVVAARTASEIGEVANAIQELGGESLAVPTDVSVESDVQAMVERTMEQFGRIDVLVNNAAIFVWKSLEQMETDEWDRTINTNLRGVFLCCKEVVKPMVEQRSGKIINMASIHGKIGDKNLVGHCSSKFGVIGLTQSLAKELREYNITVNAICPGQVDTKTPESLSLRAYTSLSMRLSPHDVAKVAVFLASEDSNPMTGMAVDIYGGTSVAIS